MAMPPENLRPHSVDRDSYQGTTLLDATMRTLLDFEHARPPVILGIVNAMSVDRKVKNVGIVVNAYGLIHCEAAAQPRVDKIFTGINLAKVHLPQEVLADELMRPDPVLHRQNWFVDTSVIIFEETAGDVVTRVLVCISPDLHEAQRMLELLQEKK